MASSENQSVRSPRWRSAASYSGQFRTRYDPRHDRTDVLQYSPQHESADRLLGRIHRNVQDTSRSSGVLQTPGFLMLSIQQMAVLVPRPRVNLTRFHGLVAPKSRCRERITPAGRGQRPTVDPDGPEPDKRRAMTRALIRPIRVSNVSVLRRTIVEHTQKAQDSKRYWRFNRGNR